MWLRFSKLSVTDILTLSCSLEFMCNLEQGATLKSLERELYEIKKFVEETPVNYVLSS